MKMTSAHCDQLRTAIEPLDTAERRQRYRTGEFPRSDRVADLNMRYRWDLYWEARNAGCRPWAYGEYNTDHIDTALRRIVPAL
ncbi:Uncharacterised protein [Mycobacteroides abscessus]|uniref:hypothetical protein n=1 Tax=Mycobacteroides abscessus TaxID=36809 RepID=UPI0005DC7398|nr:hypothetical protein [Mycobacteroides abscessus]CPT94440.1 Uncharacterised protein [Mycobacteroides abscessus]CPW13570.1 Uncharacterised protein [Mycobacteroides abscessus]CQA05058.1 Uncharacterised protein [Mycobacteroides abscessus]